MAAELPLGTRRLFVNEVPLTWTRGTAFSAAIDRLPTREIASDPVKQQLLNQTRSSTKQLGLSLSRDAADEVIARYAAHRHVLPRTSQLNFAADDDDLMTAQEWLPSILPRNVTKLT
jgi:hypothetical protein